MIPLDMDPYYLVLAGHGTLFFVSVIFIFLAKGNTRKQKIMQLLFVLLIPFIGSFVTLLVHITDRMKNNRVSDRYVGQDIDESPSALSDG